MTTTRVTVPVEPEYTATEYLRLIAEGWEVIESTGSQMTIQNPEDDGPQELVIDVDLLSAAPAPEGGAVHYGDPCIKCGVGHDNVPPGPCRGDGITISRERATEILDYLKKGSGPAGWPTTLWCEVQAFIANIEAALATREEAPAGAGEIAHWMTDLLGDDQNGGFIRNLCYTVWQAGRFGHNGTPGDWANDTLPTVQEGVKMVQAKVEGLLALRAQPQARSGEGQ